MKIYLACIFIFFVSLVVLLGDVHEKRHQDYLAALKKNQVHIPEVTVANHLLENSIQRGTVLLSDGSSKLSQLNLELYQKLNSKTNSRSVMIKARNGQKSMLSSQAVDKNYYFANSYLLGFKPFNTKNNWLPLYTIAQRKQYQLDSDQYGVDEVWQNSAQSYVNLRGDCEDHAILLADWLIEQGVDARVVLGSYQGGGHAWVIAFVDGKSFLLEATSKRVGKTWSHYPLASLTKDYEPEFMFNRQAFWANKGSLKTTNYSGSQWLKTASFKFDKAIGSFSKIGSDA
jgi:hypothetical protein